MLAQSAMALSGKIPFFVFWAFFRAINSTLFLDRAPVDALSSRATTRGADWSGAVGRDKKDGLAMETTAHKRLVLRKKKLWERQHPHRASDNNNSKWPVHLWFPVCLSNCGG